MEQNIELLLDICIDEMQKGRSIDECMASYPQYANQLKPLLQLAEQIEDLPIPMPSSEAISAALINVGKEMEPNSASIEKQEALVTNRSIRKMKRKTFSFLNIFRKPKLVWALSTFLFFVIIFSAATVSASSVPGDILYPMKLVTEKVKFLLTFDSYNKAELRLTFSDRRLNELVTVLQQSNTLDTNLLKDMLDEAKLALDENEIPVDKASIFSAKLKHVNAYQKTVLENIRPRVQTSNRQIIDEAINMCDRRGRWMNGIMDEEYQKQYYEQDSTQPTPTPHKKRQESRKWQWGPECDWME